MSYPKAREGKEEITEEYLGRVQQVYQKKMRSARQIVGDSFAKERFDLLYCDTGGGGAFDKTLQDLSFKIDVAHESERPLIIEKFMGELRP